MEVEAYRRQYAYSSSSLPNSEIKGGYHYSTITRQWVKGIYYIDKQSGKRVKPYK
jgi:hypothetical protein